VKEIFFINMAT